MKGTDDDKVLQIVLVLVFHLSQTSLQCKFLLEEMQFGPIRPPIVGRKDGGLKLGLRERREEGEEGEEGEGGGK